jgi:nitroimidazol reductase NimA-like FMN-containing flavoprotein (pyridoxamine 5'-phosphate oxidase superfamily)
MPGKTGDGSLRTTSRTRLKRLPKRGRFDRATIHAILDATPLCHVGYLIDGRPLVTPTLHWREGERVYWHGSRASRALLASEDAEVCLTVTLLDGLVLARSGFHHSANYRSVMVFGRTARLEDPELKLAKMQNFVERLYPGRWEELRPVTRKELNATTILSLPIEEASAKIREGGPIDDAADYALPIWAGVVPVGMAVGRPAADPRNLAGVAEPRYLRRLKLG